MIQADHSHMCKFENEDSPGFSLVADGIQRYAEESPAKIRRNWETEKRSRMNEKQAEAAEIYQGWYSPKVLQIQLGLTSH